MPANWTAHKSEFPQCVSARSAEESAGKNYHGVTGFGEIGRSQFIYFYLFVFLERMRDWWGG